MEIYHPGEEAFPQAGLLIGGEPVTAASGGVHEHVYPGSGRLTRPVPLAGPAEMDIAVQAARAALPGWKRMPVHLRRAALLRLADLIDGNAREIERLAVAENGITIAKAGIYRFAASDSFRYYAGWCDKIGGQVLQSWPMPGFDYTQYEPYGVIAMIIPWNVPLGALGQILAGALAAGNTVIVKPSELAPFTCLRIGELCLAAGIPPGVVNVLPSGPEGGEALVRHPGVDKVHFTGSGATAMRILNAVGLKPVGLELGGKSARLVFPEADLDAAASAAVSSVLSNCGQGCLLGTRLLVHESVSAALIERCKVLMEGYRVGNPFDPAMQVGPVITRQARERILNIVARAEASGSGTLITGGRAIEGEGFFLEPTMFVDVDNGSPLGQEEVFGPVLAVTPFGSEEEAVSLANQSPFGLGAYIHSDDYRRVHRVAAALDVGNVWVNGFNVPSSVPFGGAKQSGYGRVGGEAGLHEFLRIKNVWMAL